MATKSFRADPFESLRQTVSPSRPVPGTMDWTAEQLRNSNPRTTAPISERVSSTLRDADRYLKTGQISAPTPEGSTFVKGGKVQPKVAAPQAPTTLLGKAKTNLAPGNLLRNTGRAAGPLGAVGAALEDGISATGKAADGDYRGAAVDAGRGVTKGAGAWAGGVAGAKLGAAAGLGVSAVAPIAAPIALPVLTGLGGIGGAIAGQEGAEKAYDWVAEKLGLRSNPAPTPAVAPANSGVKVGLNTQGMPASGMPGKGRTSMDSGRNFTNELGALPRELPTEMRQGVIVKTTDVNGRPVYSGSNVKDGAQLVDGLGNTLRQGGFMGSMPGMSAEVLAGAGLRGGAGGPQAAVSAPAQGVTGGVGGFRTSPGMSRTVEQQLRDAEVQAGSIDRRTREIGLRSLERLGRLELAQGQNETQLRGAEIQAGASRYGADRRLEGDALQAEATVGAASLRGRQASAAAQVERQAVSQAWQMANGDRRVAARILDSMGFSGAKLLSSEASEQGLQIKNREDSEALLKSLSAGEDGEIDAARLARNQAVANDITGGQWSTMTPEERVQAQTKVTRAVKLLDGLNERRNVGFLKAIGSDETQMNFASLPDMQGAVVDRLSVGRPGSVERGDYRIRTKAGEEFLVPASALDEGTKAMLQKDFGIKFKE